MTPAGKPFLLRVVRQEAADFVKLVSPPENWQAPTASGHWQVRDIVGHQVDTIEGYLTAFEIARTGGEFPAPIGLKPMAEHVDAGARQFRKLSQTELLARYQDGFDRLIAAFEGLTEAEWGGFIAPHPYMGPLPAFFYPVFQLMDYGVHNWDIREGLRLPHALPADTADLLAPFMFILWQATTDLERCGTLPAPVGIRFSGRNGGSYQVTVDANGYQYTPGPVDDLPAIIDFDPGSLVLTAFGRIRGGTITGDAELAARYCGMFFLI